MFTHYTIDSGQMEQAPDPASARYAAAPAPPELRRVQSFLNTRSLRGEPDLLDSSKAANGWLRALYGGPAPRLRTADLAPLRDLRAALQQAIQSEWGDTALLQRVVGGLRWSMTIDNRRLALTGAEAEGWQALAETLLAELLSARQTAIGTRLKTCRNERCSIAFYDSSKNQSRVWHNTTSCGNLINVRASRARRKAESASSGS